MIRFALRPVWLVVAWVLACSVAMAADPPYLKLKPERMRHAWQVEHQARAKNDSLLLAEAWYLYGKTYVFAGDYRTAQAYFMKSLRIHEPRGDSDQLSRLYVRLSENEERLGHLEESLHFAKLSLVIARRIHSDKALIRAYEMLGKIYERLLSDSSADHQVNYRQVLALYRKGEALCYKTKDTMGVAEANANIGILFTRMKSPEAIPCLEKALYLFTLKDKKGIRVNTMVSLAAAYLTFNKAPQALQLLRKAEMLYDSMKLNEYDVHLVLERTYLAYFQSTGQWKAAFDHLENVHTLEKNQILADNNGAITRLNIEYETEKKEVQLAAQKRELALRAETLRTQQRFSVVMLGLLVMALVMSMVFFRLNRRNRRTSRQNAELVKEQNHRVKNNLQVVSSLLSLQSKRLTDEVAKKAVEESRLRVQSMAILHQRLYDGDKLAEANLDEFIRELVGGVLKAYGFTSVYTQFSIGDLSLSADKAVPLGLILNELTTNACKYAFPGHERAEFYVSCHKKQTKIQLIVLDNGPGLEGPGLDGPGLDRSDVSGVASDESDELAEEWSQPGVTPSIARISFGMQLIQAQVAQLAGTYNFRSGTNPLGRGVVFTLEFKG